MDGGTPVRRRGEGGHRTVAHGGDVRVEAWGTSREQCLGEAVLGLVESFADVSAAHADAARRLRFEEGSDDDLLADLLDEVVHRLEAHGEVPVDVEVESAGGELDVRLAVVRLARVRVTGSVPRDVAWNELRMGPDAYGWSCAVTADV
ncbi:archease [Streptomyces somaliensis]|uniref:archease n=1 Tax=Streptomyces somaliensis TaxID=78355 RepID=UPI0020CDE9E1|nr:archease [Streptomyces somaliensis]MCP9945379.1 archease [Streptomyces somaliensis]MCP9961416.1 archease [Streptomyces somaliensis]MCP9974225.1 archease [Streptomyces somaliensis]MCQ0024630.1 archease [Streptomyces somaliensis DSM 40738]